MQVLGRDGIGELAFLIGGNCLISIILNSFDAPTPEADPKLSDRNSDGV